MEPTLNIRRLVAWFAVLSIVLTGLLAIAPAKSQRSEWRQVQARYNRVAPDPVPVEIRQVWKPELEVVDRCTSCHLGMGSGVPVSGEPLFAAHSPLPHDPKDFGCTVCHGGQGRATTSDAAHGKVANWKEPMLPLEHAQAGCGTCHGDTRPASPAAASRGQALFARHDCRSCHRIDGVGRGDGPDLSGIGAKGYTPEWNLRHLALKAARKTGAWATSYESVEGPHVEAINAYLDTLIGAPHLMAGKALAHEAGCLGCHKLRGTGGDDGPELSTVWTKRTPEWIAEHFKDPAKLTPGSLMPDFAFTNAQARVLTTYVLSLRGPGRRKGEREFAKDGATLYGTFCAACHGPNGEGRRYGTNNPTTFPAIGNPDFLAVASDDFLRASIEKGRPGRRMPSWGTKEGGLRPEEIASLVAHLRSLAPPAAAVGPLSEAFTSTAAGDAQRGARVYAANCAGCHGEKGEGKDGPALKNAAFLEVATDGYLRATILLGRRNTAMRSFARGSPGFPALGVSEIIDIIAFIRSRGAP